MAAGTARVPTPFGDLLLAPSSLLVLSLGQAGPGRLVKVDVTIPNLRSLIGSKVPMQSLALAPVNAQRLTGSPIIEIF